jgi:hypothetical protein
MLATKTVVDELGPLLKQLDTALAGDPADAGSMAAGGSSESV